MQWGIQRYKLASTVVHGPRQGVPEGMGGWTGRMSCPLTPWLTLGPWFGTAEEKGLYNCSGVPSPRKVGVGDQPHPRRCG